MADERRPGRSDEARDPNRPVDPETGEKEGLGRPDVNPGTGKPMAEEDGGEEEAEEEEAAE